MQCQSGYRQSVSVAGAATWFKVQGSKALRANVHTSAPALKLSLRHQNTSCHRLTGCPMLRLGAKLEQDERMMTIYLRATGAVCIDSLPSQHAGQLRGCLAA